MGRSGYGLIYYDRFMVKEELGKWRRNERFSCKKSWRFWINDRYFKCVRDVKVGRLKKDIWWRRKRN